MIWQGKGRVIEASTAQKLTIKCNTHFDTFIALTMNSHITAGNQNLTYHYDEIYIPVVAEVVRASKTDEQSLNQTPGPPVEVFTTTMSNISEWYAAEKLTKSGTLSADDVDNISLKGGGRGWLPKAVTN